ncbi:MAG: TMEM175 family protein [Candidatus Nitrosopolaris sp.]
MTHEIGDHISRDRIVSLTDAVLAKVMTLLVLEIAVPEISHSEVATEFPKRLLGLLPLVWGYAISFVILGFFWIAHDEAFHYIKRGDRRLLWITLPKSSLIHHNRIINMPVLEP